VRRASASPTSVSWTASAGAPSRKGGVGFDQIFVAACRRRELEGLNLAQIATQTGRGPAETLMDLLLEEKCAVGMVSFSQSLENVAKVLAHPALMIGSDSIPLFEGEGDKPGKPHPRSYGTFPRVLSEYARERKLFSLETAVHKMTGMPRGAWACETAAWCARAPSPTSPSSTRPR